MLFAMFFPEQFERQLAMFLQLLADVKEIGPRSVGRSRRAFSGRIQRVFDALFIPFRAERPDEAGGFHARQIVVNGALTDVDAAGDLPLAKLLLEVQPQNLFDLSHGLSLSGQLWIRPSSQAGRKRPWFQVQRRRFSCSPFIPITVLPSRSPVARLPKSDRNQRRTAIGFTGER